MYLEIEIDHNRGTNKKLVTLKVEEESDRIKMKFDRRPDFDIPEFRLLKRRRREQKKSDGSASFLRAARAGNLEKVLEFLKTNTDINTCNANGLNALHLASKEGHVHVVTELLQRGASVDAATKKGNTALHIASLAGQEEIVKVLVQHQALVNIQSQNGFTPLYMAAQENHDNVVRFLLANNANQSLATEDGFTPLAVALQQGHDKVVAVLLENDTRGKVRLPALHIAAKKDDTKAAALLLHTDHNPDVTSKSGFTPLHIAAHYGNENIANLLIQRGADVNYIAKHQITPLHVASKWGKGNMVSLLIDKGANYEAKTRDGLTPLHCAARSGHETVVDMLLEKGAPITSKTKNGLAPLHMASQGDHVDAARILLYHKAPVDDVTVDYLTALHVAAHCGHVRVAKLLLDRKADPNSRALNGFTPLHIACKKNRIKVVELLLKHGASIEATTESGLTPLHVASFMGCMNIVIYLIQHGASADVPTVRGETPLHLAARANQTDIIRILLRNGAQVDARAREQQTALHIASRLGNSDIVVLLLQHGAAVDATTKDHYTALHIAAKEGQEEVASVLLEHGASLTSTTKKGFTPLHLAAKYGNMKVARLLLQKDAPVDAQGKNGVTPLHVAAHYDHQNVALLLLDKTASPHATAKNGYTPLHIAARKNQMDIATTLLEFGASANAESKAGFTPLHLSSQEGHTDMATLLIEHNASPGACAKNGLTPLHLCAQEDRVNVAAILVKHGAQIDPVTKAGYTPLHVASHFGQMNMVRFLLQHGGKVDSTTQLGYTPLHQAAQQGHTQIVNLLLENKAEPNAETNDGKTALSIAQRLGYISVVETLKIVTETTITTTTTTVTEEKYKVVVPETMHETFMSESEDEGGDDNLVSSMFGKPQHVTLPYYEGQFRYTSDDTMLGDQSYRYLTVDEMKSLGDDSLPIDVTKDEKMDVSFISNSMAAPPVAPADQLSPQHQKEHHYAQFTASYPSDNVDIAKTPILAGVSLNSLASCLSAGTNTSGMWRDRFLVSFMVDARGGAMRGCRHSGVRVIIPPRKAAMPMRITCRYLKKDKLVHAPPLMEGEALASRILEMGPAGAKFLGPVIIEVPHFASLRGKEREIVILRSDNGETWREHTLEATEEAVQEVLNESFDGEELKQLEDLNTNRITRILTTDFPQYFAIVTRIRQEVHAIGPEGGMVSSTVVPQVQAVFPQGALTKKIKVGLQAQPIPTDLVAKLLGNRVAVSPIVTVEPRRRKFHKPITLTIPVPQAASKGMINQYSGEAPTLRLLCSITGGTTRAQWEDVTGSTPLTFVNDCVSFTTTVSARFWLMDCSNIPEATKMATELYREAIHVPFMAKFVVFSKRHQLEEARVRVFCMTDDREDKTLENQEMFVEVAKSRDVEVLEGKPQFLEFAGNLVPVTKSGDQLAFNFYAFRENRLPFTVRVKDQHADCIGRVAFMRQPKVGRGDPPQTPICNLNIALPDNIQPEPAPSEPDLLALEKKYSFLSISKADTIHKADLRLTDISNMLGTDWVGLARELEISDSDINIIKSQYPDNAPQQAIVMLRLWMQTSGNKANGNTLEKGLRKIGRDDIVNQCIFNVELVTDDIERAMAKAHLDQSGFEAFREELGPSRDATLNRDISLDVSYDEQDMMKEAESAEEEEENQRTYQEKTSREQRAADMSPTYESEEKKYAGEEKVVAEEKVSNVQKDEPAVIATTTIVDQPDVQSKKDTIITEVKRDIIEEKLPSAVAPTEKVKEQMAEKVEERVLEEKVEEKPIIDIEKHVEVVDKVQESKLRSEIKAPEAPEDKTMTTTKVVEGPDGTVTTTTTTTTERRSFVTSDDDAVQEHIVIEKRTTNVVDGITGEEDKSDILQRLGEELGRLDEKLEEKFKEKRKTEEPEEGFTQTSVEKSQMSSTRGTADVSTAGTTVATGQPVVDTVLQAGPVLTHQMSPQLVDRRIARQDALTHSEQGQQEAFSKVYNEDQNGRTEERGCSPITVLEGRAHEGDSIPIRPLSRSGAHTITTTTSWGAPVSTTTSIQVDDSKTDNCVQLTLHSESHVTLHAPGEIWGELPKVKPEGHKENASLEDNPSTKEFATAIDSGRILDTVAHDSGDSINEEEYHKEVVLTTLSGVQIPQNESRDNTSTINSNQQIPSNIDYRDLAVSTLRKVETNIYRDRISDASSAQVSRSETETLSVDETSSLITTVDECLIHSPVDKFSTEASLSPECEEIQVMQSSLVEELKAVCDNSLVLSEGNIYAANESLAPSAHRPTTLMITSNSNESTDDAECITNDPTKNSGENEKSQDLKQDTCTEGMEMLVPPQGVGAGLVAVGNDQLQSEGGAIPRSERPSRPAPRTTTLVKVKVEKRPVGSHSQVRDRTHEPQSVHVPSVEEEVRGLMQEVKEATSQIKQEVKELRQADTPTPDTPTPLREFREFLNREEEQEQERLPTIKEMCRESEEDASINAGGEIFLGNEYLQLDLGLPISNRSTSAQFIHHGFDESIHPDSGYSTLEGYYAVGTDPSNTKYIPSYSEPVSEGSSSEPCIKFELGGSSSFVDSSDLSPVESVSSATLHENEKQGKSKFKSFMKRVRQLTAKGHDKPGNIGSDCQGVEPQAKDMSSEVLPFKIHMEGTCVIDSPERVTVKQPPQICADISINLGETIEDSNDLKISQKEKGEGRAMTSGFVSQMYEKVFVSSSATVSDISKEEFEALQCHHKPGYSLCGIVCDENKKVREVKSNDQFISVINKLENATEQRSVSALNSSKFHADDFKLETEFSGLESHVIGLPLSESPLSESSPTGSQYTESLITEPSTSDYSPEGVTFEMDNDPKKLEVEKFNYGFKTNVSYQTKEYAITESQDVIHSANASIVLPTELSPEIGGHLLYKEKDDDFEMCHKDSTKILETLIEEDETENEDICLEESKCNTSVTAPVTGNVSKTSTNIDLLGVSTEKVTIDSGVDEIHKYGSSKVMMSYPSYIPKLSCSSAEGSKAKAKSKAIKDHGSHEINKQDLHIIGMETFDHVFLVENMEDMQEVEEFDLSPPNYVTLATSIHQADYPQTVQIHHEIFEGPLPEKICVNPDIPIEMAVAGTGSVIPDMHFVHVTEIASYVNDMEVADDFSTVSEIHPEAMTHEKVFSHACISHETGSPMAVAIQTKPLYSQHDQVKTQILVKDSKATSNKLHSVNVAFEKGHSSVHPEDFKTATITKEKPCLPVTIERAVQNQEIEIPMCKTGEICVPSFLAESASKSVCKSYKISDFGAVDVKKATIHYPSDVEKAVQIQETKENIDKTLELSTLHIEGKSITPNIHTSFDVASCTAIQVSNRYDIAKVLQSQEVNEEVYEAEDMILPHVLDEHCYLIVDDDFAEPYTEETTVFHSHDIHNEKFTNKNHHKNKESCRSIHYDPNLHGFDEVLINTPEICMSSSVLIGRQYMDQEKLESCEGLFLPHVHRKKAKISLDQHQPPEDIAVANKENISHCSDIQKSLDSQLLIRDLEGTEVIPISDSQVKAELLIHNDLTHLKFAIVNDEIVHQPYETSNIPSQNIKEELETAVEMILPKYEFQKAEVTEHQKSYDFDLAVLTRYDVIQSSETRRIAQSQVLKEVAMEELEDEKDCVSLDVKQDKAVKADHQESTIFDVAVVVKSKVSRPYDIQKCVQSQFSTQEVEGTCDITLPSIHKEKMLPIDHKVCEDYNTALKKGVICQICETQNATQPQEFGIAENIVLPNVTWEKAVTSVHQESKDFVVPSVRKHNINEPYESHRIVQPQITSKEVHLSSNFVSKDVRHEEALCTKHPEFCELEIASDSKNNVHHPHEIQKVAQPHTAAEVTEIASNLVSQDFQPQRAATLYHTQSSDFGVALTGKGLVSHPHEIERAVQAQVSLEEFKTVEDTVLPNIQFEKVHIVHHKNSKDLSTPRIMRDKIIQPYETKRTVLPQVVSEQFGIATDMAVTNLKHEQAGIAEHEKSNDFGVAVIRKDEISCPYESQRVVLPQVVLGGDEITEKIPSTNIDKETASSSHHKELNEFDIAVATKIKVIEPYEMERILQPQTAYAELEVVKDMITADVLLEKAVSTDHKQKLDSVVVKKDEVHHLYETQRIVQPQLTTEKMETARDMDISIAQLSIVEDVYHRESEDYNVASVSKCKVMHPLEILQTVQAQTTHEDFITTEELTPVVDTYEKSKSVDHYSTRDLGEFLETVVVNKDHIGEPYDTQLLVQPQDVEEKILTTADINIPKAPHEKALLIDHQECKDFDVAVIRKDTVNQVLDVHRKTQPQYDFVAVGTTKDIVSQCPTFEQVSFGHQEKRDFSLAASVKCNINEPCTTERIVHPSIITEERETAANVDLIATTVEKGKAEIHDDLLVCSIAKVKQDNIQQPYETERHLQQTVAVEDFEITKDMLDFPSVQLVKARPLDVNESQDLVVALVVKGKCNILSDTQREISKTGRSVQSDSHHEQLLVSKDRKLEDFAILKTEKDQVDWTHDTQSAIQSLVIPTEIGLMEEFSPPTFAYEKCSETTHKGEELFGFESNTQLLGLDIHTVFASSVNLKDDHKNSVTAEKTELYGLESQLREGVSNTKSISLERNSDYCSGIGTGAVFDENKVSDPSLVAKEMNLNITEAEQELAKIINKQMEDLIKDEEDRDLSKDEEDMKEKGMCVSDLSDKESMRNTEVLVKPMFSGSCRRPNQDSSEMVVCSSDTEKIVILDRVSDELRHMISNLEYNLSSGMSKNIKITPILARLEQLEQEVATIAKSSENVESSIPFKSDVNNDSVVSYSQSNLLEKGPESSCDHRKFEGTSLIAKMPVIVGNEAASLTLPGGHSPVGETNGVDIPEALTDVEDLLSDGDQSPLVKRKGILLVPQKDTGAITDTEDMDLSGEEDEYIQDKKNLPTIQDLGLLPEPTRELINLTEGFARQPSPLLSGSESEVEDVEGRHKKNLKKMETLTESETLIGSQVSEEVEPERLTDEENVEASGDEVEEATEAAEDSLPDHYLDQGDGISNKEKVSACVVLPKILHSHHEESSDEEQYQKQKPRRKSKGGLKVDVNEEGTTDVEDLVVSDVGGDSANNENAICAEAELKDKPKKKKQVRRKTVLKPVVSKSLMTPAGDADGLTDVEILTGDDEDEIDDDEPYLAVPEHGDGALTDCEDEDVEVSDTEDVETFIAKPVEKLEPTIIPPPHAEKIRISEAEEEGRPESGDDTDEEGFELADQEDKKPLIPRKKISYEPIETVVKETLEVEEPCEPALTDTEDFDIDDKEEEEIYADFESRIPEEGEIYTLKELEGNLGSILKTEMIRDVNADQREKIKAAEKEGLTLEEALDDDTHTDVEDLDEDEKSRKPKTIHRKENETDEESVTESDIEEELPKPTKQGKKKGRRLPLAPQISEVRFLETEQGPLSIIITPDTLENKSKKIMEDQVANVVFIEKEEAECTTDVEDLGLSDEEGGGKSDLKAPESSHEPTTDTEDLDIDPADLDRPLSPLPPNVERNLFSSPKRELIQIKEDKYGVPQVTIRKLEKDELLVSEGEDGGHTDTEDIEVTEGEALRIVGVTEDDTSDFELPDSGKVEVSSRMVQKEGLQVEPEEEDGNTDVEELPMTRKQRRKPKTPSKLVPKIQEDSHTDVEILSDQDDKSNLHIRVETPDAHTDVEDMETSEAEDLAVPSHDGAPTPDIITKSAIRKVVTLKEGPDGVVQTEESEVAPPRKNLLNVEDEPEGVTDVEDMEASGAEDEDLDQEHPPVELPEYDASNVDISEKSNLPKSSNEAKHIKDNLLLPEDNYNNLTDVESLSEGEGNRCASNTSLLSSQQLTYAVENCTVAELSYYLPTTDPKLCVHPGVSLESDPFCGELTSPLVVEAELEQVYYHAPKEGAHKSEVELEASDGCVVRKRQVVASMCQAREVRRFWSLDRNSPLSQSEISAFAAPTIHKKGFKTILYLEQPNLLDTISISDTLCDSGYFRNERILDFDSSSIDSFDDHFSYRDSDIVTVVDQFNQERGSSSFDDLPSPHLSSISSTGIVDSMCSGKSFNSDCQYSCSPQSPMFLSTYSKCSSEDFKKESEQTLSLSGISALSCSPDTSLLQEAELYSLDAEADKNIPEEIHSVSNEDKPLHDSFSVSSGLSNGDRFLTPGSVGESEYSPVMGHPVSEMLRGLAMECHESFTTECLSEYASKYDEISAKESTESSQLENCNSYNTNCIKGFATESIEMPPIELVDEIVPNYAAVDAALCMQNSPTGLVQRSITEWIVGRNVGQENKEKDVSSSQKFCQLPDVRLSEQLLSESTKNSTVPVNPPILWLKGPQEIYPMSVNMEGDGVSVTSNIDYITELRQLNYSTNLDSFNRVSLLSSDNTDIPFEDSGVHENQSSGSFTSSHKWHEPINVGYESDHISQADSVLGLDGHLDKYLVLDAESSESSALISTSKLPVSHIEEEKCLKKHLGDESLDHAAVVPLTWRHTLPRTFSQVKSGKTSHTRKISGSIAKDFEEISKDFAGVKGLIDQWEVIVREEQMRSLPASPAVGRKILPPYDGNGNKKTNIGNLDEMKIVAENSHTKDSLQTTLTPKSKDADSFDGGGGNVIEEVASVCDIIQQFEGRVGRLGRVNAHTQRLRRGSQSPASRSPSHQRRVATVKPLCEPQLQEKSSSPLQEGQMQPHHQEQLQELLEHTVSAGFVPRVVESLSITKCSNEMCEESPPQASVSNPEGTHEATHIAEQQPTSISHDQGLDVEEMSNIMESYTSDGSDLITSATHTTSDGSDLITTTTHTTTSIDPDPITSTQITRITTRTEIKDGEIKEDIYEEY